jgi:hypothetical protein
MAKGPPNLKCYKKKIKIKIKIKKISKLVGPEPYLRCRSYGYKLAKLEKFQEKISKWK